MLINFPAADPRGIKRSLAALNDSRYLDFWHTLFDCIFRIVRSDCADIIAARCKIHRPIIAFWLPASDGRFLWRWYSWWFALFSSDYTSATLQQKMHGVIVSSDFQKLDFIAKRYFFAYFFEFFINIRRYHCLPICASGSPDDKAKRWHCVSHE